MTHWEGAKFCIHACALGELFSKLAATVVTCHLGLTVNSSQFVRASSASRSIFMPPKHKRVKLTQKRAQRRKAELKWQCPAETPDCAVIQPSEADNQRTARDYTTDENKLASNITCILLYLVGNTLALTSVHYFMCTVLCILHIQILLHHWSASVLVLWVHKYRSALHPSHSLPHQVSAVPNMWRFLLHSTTGSCTTQECTQRHTGF